MSYNYSSAGSGDNNNNDANGWDGDRYVTSDGTAYDTSDYDFEWSTGHTPCGDDDN